MVGWWVISFWCLFSGAFPRSFRDLFFHDTHTLGMRTEIFSRWVPWRYRWLPKVFSLQIPRSKNGKKKHTQKHPFWSLRFHFEVGLNSWGVGWGNHDKQKELGACWKYKYVQIGSMGVVYLPTLAIQNQPNVGKCASPMDEDWDEVYPLWAGVYWSSDPVDPGYFRILSWTNQYNVSANFERYPGSRVLEGRQQKLGFGPPSKATGDGGVGMF